MFTAHSTVLSHATNMSQKQQFLSQNYMLLKNIYQFSRNVQDGEKLAFHLCSMWSSKVKKKNVYGNT
jgi:hypothetical protein